MINHDPDRLPDDLREIDARLKGHRTEFSALELDQLKLRTASQAFKPKSRYGRQYLMRSKLVTMMLVLGLAISGGAAGVIAGSGGGGKAKSADQSEYKPGKGCGDKNHVHVREDECLDKPGTPPK